MFQYRLAEHLGRTRRELLATADAAELAYWRAKERIDGPIGARQETVRTARLAMLISAAIRPGADHALFDYLPAWLQEQPEVIEAMQTPADEAETRATFDDLVAAWNR